MTNSLRKIVLLTGATSGIGKATARLLAKKGYSLILTGRRADRLEELKLKYTKKYGVNIHSLSFDIQDWTKVEQAYKSLPVNWKKIDILINNTGLAKGFDYIHRGKIDDWKTMMDTNVNGLLYITRLVTPAMVKRKKGHIINICSSAGHEVYPKGNVYCASKFAVDALTKSMRLDLHTHGIRVSQISPGQVEETEFALVRAGGDKKKSSIYEDFNPLKAKDVAEVIYFVITRPKYVNIQQVSMFGTQQASNAYFDRSGRKYDK